MLMLDAKALFGVDLPWDPESRVWTVKVVDDLHVMVTPFIYTAGIIVRHGVWDPETMIDWYSDRWCYETARAAVEAAVAWDPAAEDEPTGWHRHPLSGRRRPDGDPSREHVAR